MNNRENSKALNALKGLGAFIIAFVYHYKAHFLVGNLPFEFIFNPFYDYGYLMVELFFVLSGFGMMMGYAEKIINHKISFRIFIIKRIKKIYPLFLFALVLVTIGQLLYKYEYGVIYLHDNFDLYHFVLNLFLIQNGIFGTEMSFNTPGWCISIYFILYFVFYITVYYSSHIKDVLYKFMGLALVGLLILQSGWNYSIINAQVGRGLFCFALGIFIAYFYEKRECFKYKVVGGSAFVITILNYIYVRSIDIETISHKQYLFIILVIPTLVVSVLFLDKLNNLLSMRIFQFLGGISIEIYLLHFPIQVLFKDFEIYFHHGLDWEKHSVWVIYVLITIASASCYKYFINAKFTRLLIKLFLNDKYEN